MSAPIMLDVRGIPAAQGSTRAFVVKGKAIVTHGRTAPMHAWREAIATEARAVMKDQPLVGGPVSVTAWFRLPRPKSAPKRVTYPSTRPDLDKLLRAVLDALTGVVFGDDAQVARISASKAYPSELQGPGVFLLVAGVEE